MRQYLDLMRHVLEQGVPKRDRTGTGTLSVFGHQLRFDLSQGFPLLTTRKLWVKAIVHELLWFLSGATNVRELREHGITIWDAWADETGELGPLYGSQWRSWPAPDGRTIDQLGDVIEEIKQNPESRRLVVSAWNVAELDRMALPPCFAGDTLVATPEGYRPIAEIDAGDTVISGSCRPRVVRRAWKTTYRGPLVALRPWFSPRPLRCTPNHPFLVRGRGWVPAQDIRPGDSVAWPRPRHTVLPTLESERRHNLWGTRLLTRWQPTVDDFFTFGYFLGDGWCSHRKGHWRIAFSVRDSQAAEIVPRLRRTLKVRPRAGGGRNVTTYDTFSKRWIGVFRQFGHGAAAKRIPAWVFDVPEAHISAFVEGYRAADGSQDGDGTWRFTTVSPDIAFGLQRLLARAGRVTGISFHLRPATYQIEGRTVRQRHTYDIRVATRRGPNRALVRTDHVWVQVRSVEHEPEQVCPVYNLDVAQEHTYLAENVVTHNCHALFQFSVADGRLSCQLYQRSADVFLGLPFNIAEYALLTLLVAQVCDLRPGELIHTLGDAHLYLNHLDQARLQLTREPYPPPRVDLDPRVRRLSDFRYEHFTLKEYRAHPHIRAEVAV